MADSACKDGQCRMKTTGIGRISSYTCTCTDRCVHARSCEGGTMLVYMSGRLGRLSPGSFVQDQGQRNVWWWLLSLLGCYYCAL